ncbi:hypothetical protein CAOG_08824 [Capsaspora owczarzaki ATCC 30864]|uniref:DNA helicase MCM8 n=1 Tax=Capsaspora owczarzaki (strain ATCC 30864) TaxID=595528 RepID=A0A0D2WS20_CAPO3|nr:hypothetical protein CAOG_08824 [Capsaspora owczarzaki ATCC 30864]KJE94138.1 hypothetical protein CAOG_008824 [Capsaspora owczarzaki ATCC 30864]|eukprot:XP_011270464.1 hypothetical protein CAOG_08824 [Capsaspora owczarzaki ATCC 30864]
MSGLPQDPLGESDRDRGQWSQAQARSQSSSSHRVQQQPQQQQPQQQQQQYQPQQGNGSRAGLGHPSAAPGRASATSSAVVMDTSHGSAFGAGSGGNNSRAVPSAVTRMPVGWLLYFPNEDFEPAHPFIRPFVAFRQFFKSRRLPRDRIEARKAMTIDANELVSACLVDLPNLATDLREQPSLTLATLSLALYEVMYGEVDQDVHLHAVGNRVFARVVNVEPVSAIRSLLKSNAVGRLVSLRGTVVRVGNIKPQVVRLAFTCSKCDGTTVIALADGRYAVPSRCTTPQCRGSSFVPRRSDPDTIMVDWQTIRVQEILDDGDREAGRIPPTIECELSSDLVDACVPGDVVTVVGEVKMTSVDTGRGKRQFMFSRYVEANSVCSTKNNNGALDLLEFSLKELYAIQQIQAHEHLFHLLVNSLSPGIYGHELVKAGLLLSLFGGCQRFTNDRNRIPVRGDPHILVVGDPGLGKSQMLQAVNAIVPRGVYVCGNTTTTSGLTVTLLRDGASGDYALEAGALVLSDQGCCCIDEFDKMSSEHQALLEAMEQQSVSIAKAGIVCTLPARASIIAAANPVGGHYNKAKTVAENLRMGSALLSRFDLVFILLDKPDIEMDRLLSEHVMALHSSSNDAALRARQLQLARKLAVPGFVASPSNSQLAGSQPTQPLVERLRIAAVPDFDPIPPPLLRKYVGYARKYVHPKLTNEAASVIQEFYLALRKKHHSLDSTPITTRQLESIIRLSEARARMELREIVTADDARDVIEIMRFSMIDTNSDEVGNLDFARSQNGSGMSRKAQGKRFIAELRRISEETFNTLFSMQQLRETANLLCIRVESFPDFIQALNNENYLLKKSNGIYQLQI